MSEPEFDLLARQMAAEVHEGDTTSAYALADILLEARAKGQSLITHLSDTLDRPALFFEAVQKMDRPTFGRSSDRKLSELYFSLFGGKWSTEELFALRVLYGKLDRRKRYYLDDLWRLWEPTLTHRAGRALARLGLVTPMDVRAVTPEQLRQSGECGDKTIDLIARMLQRYGLLWPGYQFRGKEKK